MSRSDNILTIGFVISLLPVLALLYTAASCTALDIVTTVLGGILYFGGWLLVAGAVATAKEEDKESK